ncbi:MAG: M14 family zinc carboxypeptidase [Candidatus Staskawiczbacteria bacterium]|jgi:predicted deacylase
MIDFNKIDKKYLLLICWLIIITILLFVQSYFQFASFFDKNEAKLELSPSDKLLEDNIKVEEKIFGYSVKNRPISGYEIGSGANAVLLIGGIHGNEHSSVILLNKLISEIKNNPNVVSKNKKIIIIPDTNPDGSEFLQKFNANGVNLNLNFDTPGWKNYGPLGTYAGPEPFSEVESRIIKQIVQEYNPQMLISFHGAGALVTPEEETSSKALARWYAQKTGYTYYDTAASIADNLNWDFPGTATRWFTENNKKPSITVELTTLSQSDWDINKPAIMDIISQDNI